MHHLDLDTLTLDSGFHHTRDDGVCLLEAVAWWAGEDHTDRPQCVSPILGAMGRHLNDVFDDATRQKLKPYIPQLPGTADEGLDEARGYLALDWLIRTWTPAWLDLAGLADEARQLRELRRIVDMAAAKAAGPVVKSARTKAAAARDDDRDAAWAAARDDDRAAARDDDRDAARAAAWDAAWAAAWDAAWAAAWDAAGAAAWDAAGAAAWDAAGAAAWDAAGDAAWDAARDAAGAAARDAARAAARAAARDDDRDAAWAAARDAARAKLAPTVSAMQDSIIALYGQMIRPESPAAAR